MLKESLSLFSIFCCNFSVCLDLQRPFVGNFESIFSSPSSKTSSFLLFSGSESNFTIYFALDLTEAKLDGKFSCSNFSS